VRILVDPDIVDSRGKPVPAVLDASIVADHGIRISDRSASIVGNLAVGRIHKDQIQRGKHLHVKYNADAIGPRGLASQVSNSGRVGWVWTNRDFNDGSWHHLAVTPRFAGYYLK